MTRVTNFGRKRKYVEAGFSTTVERPTTDGDATTPVHPKKKKLKGPKTRERPQKTQSYIAISGYKKRTEQRRLKRTADRQAETICFACREKGHAARDCPKAGQDGHENVAVGMCYRCGSTKHTLSRCKKPEDPLNPLPFASCFVCSGEGHLASTCPQNKEKGVYPNGGSCKLCGENTHLAKDCELRKKDMAGTAATTIFGTGTGAGADEDDFHTFKRKNTQVSRDEKRSKKRRKRVEEKTSLHTDKLNASGMSSKPKKVVFF